MTHHFYHPETVRRRQQALTAVSRLSLSEELVREISNLPGRLSELSPELWQCLPEAAMVGSIRSALGLSPNGSSQMDSLPKAATEALTGGEITEPTIEVNAAACDGCGDTMRYCESVCQVDAISRQADGTARINHQRCLRCGLCIPACPRGAVTDKGAILPAIRLLQSGSPVYAAIAPAFAGQFDVAEAQVKAGLLRLGFADVVEVALAADVVTINEAEEFIDRVGQGEKFMITSCCCPSFLKLVEKYRPKLAALISPSVSPMIGSGRLIKARDSAARVIFIGPCIAKKSEALLPELADAIDCVLTFQELASLFAANRIDLTALSAAPLQDASHDGRIFGHTGGVSVAVARSVERLQQGLSIVTTKGDGIVECKQILEQAAAGSLTANFIEGMACPGGCVGGPGKLVETRAGAAGVDDFADSATSREAAANPRARELAQRYHHRISLVSIKHGGVGSLGLSYSHSRPGSSPESVTDSSDKPK